MKRLYEDDRFTVTKEHFLFKILNEVKENVFEGWELFDVFGVNLY